MRALWLTLAALLLSVPGLAASGEERAEFALQWWVGKDGTSTKIYTVKYGGPQTLARLKEFSQGVHGAEGFLSNLLPYREASDALVEFKNLGVEGFRWVYRARPLPAQGESKDHLLLWLPVWEDPVSRPWDPKPGSRVRFRARDFQIVNRLEVRVPWQFQAPAPREDHLLSQNHVEAHYKVRPILDPLASNDPELRKIPGWDQPGIELSSELATTEGELSRETINRLHEAHSGWVLSRLAGVLWARVPRDPIEQAYGTEPHSSGSFDLGYTWLWSGANSFRGLSFGFGARSERYLGAGFTWRSLALDLRFALGSDLGSSATGPGLQKFSDIRLSLSSILQYRLTALSGFGEGERQITFMDFYAGPSAQAVWLNDAGLGLFNYGLAPGAVAGVRWGISNPRLALMAGAPWHMALGLRWDGISSNQFGGSRLALLLEFF